MIEKEYYRLDDLKHRFNMTDSDVLYLIAEKNVPPCFYMPKTDFIIGGWLRNDFIGHANVSYEGLVAIPQRHVQELVNKRKVLPYYFNLLNKSKIRQIDTDYDFELPLPNNYIQGWKAKDVNEIGWPMIPAKLYPFVAATMKHTFKDLLMSFAKDDADKAATARNFDKSFGETQRDELRPVYKTFLFSDVCIRHEDLVSLGVININQGSNAKPQENILADIECNDFDKILIRMVLSNRKLSAKPAFKILANECQLEEDCRTYDIDGILLEQVDGVIIWKDALGSTAEKRCSLATLANKLSHLRKKIAVQGK